uniref:Epidermal retinol dehydrogenase 2 n=1 Tax=Octopus bimaculoides TaxID=37653 RepID=A0A0L8I2T1_OCTBM
MVLWDIDVQGNDTTAKAIKELGGSCYQYTVDLGNKDEIYETARKTPLSRLHYSMYRFCCCFSAVNTAAISRRSSNRVGAPVLTNDSYMNVWFQMVAYFCLRVCVCVWLHSGCSRIHISECDIVVVTYLCACVCVNEDIGMVHILINNAGIVTGRKFLQCPDELIQKTIDVNTMAHFWTVKAFLPTMIKENHGHVVTVASAAGLLGVNSLTDYCASKFAVVGFEESLRFELEVLGKDGVHTTVVCPFYINTGMFNGVKVRFPYLMPILEPGYVSDKIVEAVRCNTHILYIPRLLYYTLGLKGLLPHKCISLLARFFGVSTDMEKFKGKLGQKKE